MSDKTLAEGVLWIPSHPSQGSISMQRYWAALRDASCGMGIPVASALEEPVIPVAEAGRIRRAFDLYRAYPQRCLKLLVEGNYKLAHILDHSFAHLLGMLPPGCRSVVTVHDLIPFREPGRMTALQRRRFRNKMGLLRDADRLVAVSESTRNDLVEILDIAEEKITVVLNGVQPTTRRGDEACSKMDALLDCGDGDRPFDVLSIGLAVPRKNLELLPDVFRSLGKAGVSNARLIRVGDRLPKELLQRVADVIGEDRIVECGRISDAELGYLYQVAGALVFPSTHEGFGLPVVEAMVVGCPVAASRIPSHQEVGGECAYYFDPADPEEAGRVLAVIAEGGEDVARRLEQGKERAAEFTWERHLEGLLGVYRDVLAEG